MDPNAALNQIIDAAVAGDAEALGPLVIDLGIWLAAGGFPPDDPRTPRPEIEPQSIRADLELRSPDELGYGSGP